MSVVFECDACGETERVGALSAPRGWSESVYGLDHVCPTCRAEISAAITDAVARRRRLIRKEAAS